MRASSETASPIFAIPSRADNDNWLPTPAISAEVLEGTFWQLSFLGSSLIAPFVVLAPGGYVGNYNHPTAEMWQVVNGSLYFVGSDGLPTANFNAALNEDGKLVALAGRGTIGGVQGLYMLTVTEHPPHPLYATSKDVPRRAHFLSAPSATRPNLVIVPAGKNSLHFEWLRDMKPTNRNWDLCVGWYGKEEPELSVSPEYLAHIPATKKFRILYDVLYEGSPLWNYQNIWFPDDDLLTDGQSINRMFHIFSKYGLDLAQPSLREGEGSYPNHPVTVQRPGSILRYEKFVEIMCPIFSMRALKICFETMRDTESGYGLDYLWPAFLGSPPNRMGIIDAVSVDHTRPIGATYSVQSAVVEQSHIFRTYGFTYAKIAGVK